MKPACALLMASCLVACTQFPELDAAQTPGVAEAPYPALVPIDTLTRAPAPLARPEDIVTVEARAAALTARADRLQRVNASQSGDVQTRLARLRQRAEALRAVQ